MKAKRRHHAARDICAVLGALLVCTGAMPQEEQGNFFNDPFIQVTHAIVDCPMQRGPMITRAEMRAQSHSRIDRGTTCYRSGRCRLPNAFLYDKEIIPRVSKLILSDGRFLDSSIMVEGQRRWVWLKGCVRKQADADALQQLVRSVDDVEAVISELVVRAAK